MNELQAIVAYWLDCIKSESALEQNFGINTSKFGLNTRTRATLFEDTKDPFIFSEIGLEYFLEKGKAYELVAKSTLKGQDVYFGYPLLMFFDSIARKNRVAPLFVMRLEADVREDSLILRRAEPSPMLGSNAFEKLGLKQEEIAALNDEVSEIFKSNKSSKLETILYLLKKETRLTFIEGINPNNLSTDTTIHPYDGNVIYNKAILFASEASVYNLHLLNDLEQLVKRDDLNDTSLKYITSPTTAKYSDLTPVLPFAFDEHQLLAIRRILDSEHTVVTGPPGTGKSQFIANLIINLFLQKKKVLFVSHTGEAVRVVNERINKNFANLIMQTGKKETRQDLGRRLAEMVEQYNDQQAIQIPGATLDDITRNWNDIKYETAYLRQTNKLHKKIEEQLSAQQTHSQRSGIVQWLTLQVIRLQMSSLLTRSRKRRNSIEVLASIGRLKTHHVEISRSYVRANYLAFILESGLYGELLAYVDSVQNKKFNQGHIQDKGEKYINAALGAMNVWSCTLKSLAATFPLRANLFDYVIFDEASQIDLPSAAPALYRARNAVVVGDGNQLTHIAKINKQLEEELAEKHKLSALEPYPALVRYTDVSLFNSAKRALNEPEHELKNHYRSNTLIANLFSGVFYDGRLKIHEPNSSLPGDIQPGVYWVDVKGTAHKYKTGSKYNSEEAAHAVKLLERLIPVANERGLTIGVTTPYSKQQDVISNAITAAFDAEVLANVRVLTVHKFQGSEVDILIFSPVLAHKGDGGSDYWYIKSKQILNVAVSRAKQLLLIVGDLDHALQSQSKLKDIAEYCNRIGQNQDQRTPNRPMNIFEKELLGLLQKSIPRTYAVEPQYVVGNRFTIDFALLSKRRKIAVELDGRQHEIVGGLPVFEDKQRDAYLTKEGWHVIRITVYELLKQPDQVVATLRQAIGKNR
ncbi:MAG TPA: AAA domain-containing protein [Candidatus Saccharimonadales bacterium]|nr:AAA domain-containing protein [Candidatus Saccharimonadales bacterium]